MKGGDKYCANIPQVKQVKLYSNTTDTNSEIFKKEFEGKYTCIDTATGNPKTCEQDDFTVSYLHAYSSTVKTSYIPPLECANNGLCDRTQGLCNCFEGYYGLACTEATPVV